MPKLYPYVSSPQALPRARFRSWHRFIDVSALRLAFVLPLLLALLPGCGGDPEPLRVGVVADGEALRAARLAAADVNRTGGIDGRPLEIRTVTVSRIRSARAALIAADSLASDPSVLGIVGHTTSSASLAAAGVYNAARVAHIAPNATAPLFREAGEYSFRLVPSDDHQARFLAEVARGSGKGAAIVYSNDDYGRAFDAALRGELGRVGIPVRLESSFAAEKPTAEYLAEVAGSVAASGAEIVFWVGFPSDLSRFMEALRTRAPGVRVLASDGLDRNETYQHGAPALVGVRFVRFVDLEDPDAALRSERERFQAETGMVPFSRVALTYDAVRLLAEALRSGARTREEVKEYLSGVGSERPPYRGLAGPVSFDEKGDVMRPYYLAEISRQGIRTVDP